MKTRGRVCLHACTEESDIIVILTIMYIITLLILTMNIVITLVMNMMVVMNILISRAMPARAWCGWICFVATSTSMCGQYEPHVR